MGNRKNIKNRLYGGKKQMIELYALTAGIIVGLLFGLIKLPVPAPQTLAGILGLVGIYVGFKLTKILLVWVK